MGLLGLVLTGVIIVVVIAIGVKEVMLEDLDIKSTGEGV